MRRNKSEQGKETSGNRGRMMSSLQKLTFILPQEINYLDKRAMGGSSAVKPFPAHSHDMKNIVYTGDAGSHSLTPTTEYPSATSPLIRIVEDHEDTCFLLRYLLEKWTEACRAWTESASCGASAQNHQHARTGSVGVRVLRRYESGV
jgi:hypothetical protein